MLKGQDLLVALHAAGGAAPTLAAIAKKLGMSYGEVHASVGRLQASQLLAPSSRNVIRPHLKEFVLHGARYAFPPKLEARGRGIPTGNLVEPLKSKLIGDELSLVWRHPEGTIRAPVLVPIYKDAPVAALNDPALHRKLALLDALRVGGARARAVAAELLGKELDR